MRPRVALVDYEAGNLLSISKGLERAGADVSITRTPQPGPWDAVVLPGVGHFGAAMARLEAAAIPSWLRTQLDMGTTLIGVCLGMQLLFDRGEEGGGLPGLGILQGEARRLPEEVKLPHMGWNRLRLRRPGVVLQGLEYSPYAYFVHSYFTAPADPDVVAATTRYGVEFPAVVESGRVIGLQFHPEKSAEAGAHILRNIVLWIRALSPERAAT